MTTTTAQRDAEIARNILDQIPNWLRFALGIRERYIISKGLRFTITGTRRAIIEITLDEGTDLYRLIAFTERRKKGERIPTRTIRYEADGIYADQMLETLDRIDRGQITL
jgi:hypothetical protein